MMRALIAAALLVLALIAALWGTYDLGKVSGKAMCEAAQAKANEAPRAKQKAATQATVNRGVAKGAKHERNRVALDNFFNQLEKEQDHASADPVDSCVLPAERLRSWTDANAGRTTPGAAPVQPDSAAPAVTTPGLRADAGLGIKPPRDSAGLSPAGAADVQPVVISGDQP